MMPKSVYLKPLSWAVSPKLVTDKVLVDGVIDEATRTICGLKDLLMPVPCASIRTQQDVDWVSQPGRYTVAHKCNGTRYLLIVLGDGRVFFKNRVDFVYSYPIEPRLPGSSVLDGELVWCSDADRGYFLVFDALAVAGRRVWGLPLDERLAALRGLTESDEALPPAKFNEGMHRQRAPSEGAAVRVLLKRHFPPAQLDSQCPYPQDGVVCTPVAMPYVTPLLVRKWQPAGKRACDLRGEHGLVYECVPARAGQAVVWRPVAIRWDKAQGNAGEGRGGGQGNVSI